MLQSEITGLTLAFLLLGPLTTVLVAPRLVRQVKHARIRDLYLPGLVSLVLLGLVLQSPFVVQSPSPMYASFARSVFAGMVDDIWFNPLLEVRREVLGEIDRAGKPNWNSTNAKALATPTTEKLNVVIVMLESARATSTSLYNKSLRTTPFLESLAKDSAVADSMYVVVPRTASAWISILYGLYPIDDISMRPWIAQQATRPISRGLADVLRDHGYRSAFFTSIGLNLDKERDIVTNMRFDLLITKEDLAASPGQWRNYMGLEDKVLLAPIDKWMRAQHAERNPFLLVVMTNIGHHDWKTPPTWPQQDFVDGANKNRALNSYLNSLAYIDSFIEKLFDSISAAGLADSTIVVVVGDHGESMGEHDGAIAVRTLYEESIHVPALIYAPRFKGRAARIPGVRQQVDLFPTIMQLLGYEIADAVLPGTSLLADVPADRKIYLGSNIEQSFLGAMQGGGKYVYYFRRRPIEYFNLREDPMEQRPRFVEMRSAEERAIERELLLWYERAAFSLIPPSVRSRY
jgi:arylsulfatase A-like enzyme